jgi:hypothetical protein
VRLFAFCRGRRESHRARAITIFVEAKHQSRRWQVNATCLEVSHHRYYRKTLLICNRAGAVQNETGDLTDEIAASGPDTIRTDCL